MSTTTDQGIIGFIKLIKIIVQVSHGHETFAFIVVQLHIQSPFGDARYHAIKNLPDFVAHKLHLLVFDRSTFRVGRQLFHLRAMIALFFTRVLRNAPTTVRVTHQEPVRHHIGIAADGRGEMRIVGKGQAIVPDVFRRVAGLLHGSHGQRFDQIFLRPTLRIV